VTPSEPLPKCRRRALWSLAAGLACLALSWASGHLGWGWPDRINGFLAGMGVGAVFAAALLWFMPDMSDAVPKRIARRYQREVAISMGAYVLVMLFWKQLLGLFEATWLRVLVALFPALLVCWVMRAFVRYVRDSDEMQRRIELESGSIAAMLVAAGYLGAGFLQSAKLINVPSTLALIGVFPALCLFYGITKVVVARRYL
jgi:hypothetical protein